MFAVQSDSRGCKNTNIQGTNSLMFSYHYNGVMLIERKDVILLSFSADRSERAVVSVSRGLSLGEVLLLHRERLKAGEMETIVKGTLIKLKETKCVSKTQAQFN